MATQELIRDVPAHVPPELVVPFDQYHGEAVMAFPPTAALQPGKPIFYSSMYGGFWVVTKYETARAIYQDPDRFHQWSKGIPANPFSKLYKPLYLNPPDHMVWRKVLTPLFSPRQLQRYEEFIRGVVRRQIAKIAPQGRCELVSEFADVIPGEMFCFMLGLDKANYPKFAQMAHDLIFGPAQALKDGGSPEKAREARVKANKEIDEFIAALIPERRKNPGEDIVSVLLDGRVNGEPLTEDDIVTMTTLLFFAGTDSTRAAITYGFNYLAQNPDQRDRLVADPTMAKQASEELLRFHGFHMSAREVVEDTEVDGVLFKRGDVVTLSTGAANRDPDKFPHPDQVDLERADAHSHLTFGAGPHRCIGSHSATLQYRIALEEWHQVIKDYRPDPDAPPMSFIAGQGKAIPQNLSLVFTPVQPDMA
jgi:cytochrome P450